MVKRGIAMDYNQYRLLEPKDLEIQKSITFSQKYSESGRRAHRPIRAPQLDTTKRVRRRQWARVHLEFGMDFWEKVILF